MFAVTRIFFNVGFQTGVENMLAIGLAVKACLEIERRTFDLDARFLCNTFEVFQALCSQHAVGLINRRERQRGQAVTVVVRNGDHFFTFLVFVAAVADSVAPFLATVLEPSPGNKLKSSFFSSDKCLTEAMKAFFNEPSSAPRAKSL